MKIQNSFCLHVGDCKKEENFLGVLFCEILSHLHVMVLDNQYNALSAGVSIQWETIHFMHFKVWLRCNSEGLGSPNWIRVSALEAIKGVAPCIAAQEGLGVSLSGGGKGIAKGPLPVLHW